MSCCSIWGASGCSSASTAYISMPLRGQGLQACFTLRQRCRAVCGLPFSSTYGAIGGDNKILYLAAMEDLAVVIDTGDRPSTTYAKPIATMQGDGLQVLNPTPGWTPGSLPRNCRNTNNDKIRAIAGIRALTLQQDSAYCVMISDAGSERKPWPMQGEGLQIFFPSTEGSCAVCRGLTAFQ